MLRAICITLLLLLPTAMASPDVTCPQCMDIVGIVEDLANNNQLWNLTIDTLTAACEAKYAGNSTIMKDACVAVMGLVAEAIPLLIWGMDQLAWNIPLTFCSNIVKVCFQPCCNNSHIPEQVHINFADTNDLGHIRVTWVTLNQTEGAMVQYWYNGSGVASSMETTRTYTHGGWEGVIHAADMTGLPPGTQVTYRVGSDAFSWSRNFTFSTLPSDIGTEARPLRVIQIADMGYGPNSNVTVAMIEKWVDEGKVDFIIHNGDIGYADADEHHWDYYFQKIESIVTRMPYMTTPGNHEFYWNFSAYRQRLHLSMPTAGAGSLPGAMYYALNVGPVAFLLLNSETVIDTANIDPAQVSWIAQQIANVNRSSFPFLVALQHRALYMTGSDPMMTILRGQVETLFNTGKVDMNIAGHYHCYERMYPLVDGVVVSENYTNPTTPIYIVNGAAGNREGNGGANFGQPWVAAQTNRRGFGYLTLAAGSAVNTINYKFVLSDDGSVLDDFTIVKTK